MGCDTSKSTTSDQLGQENLTSLALMKQREELMLQQFGSILNNINDGIIIKSANHNKILFCNETANAIFNRDDVEEKVDSAMLNLKRFTKVDLKEKENPLFDDEDDLETSPVNSKKISLNTIVKNLANHGDNAFSESTIYKVSIPRRAMELALKEGRKPITHVMVEATLNVYRDEAAVTMYLRNVSYVVEVQKNFLKAQEEQALEEAEDEVIQTIAKVTKAKHATPEKVSESQGADQKETIAVEHIENGEANLDDILLLLENDEEEKSAATEQSSIEPNRLETDEDVVIPKTAKPGLSLGERLKAAITKKVQNEK